MKRQAWFIAALLLLVGAGVGSLCLPSKTFGQKPTTKPSPVALPAPKGKLPTLGQFLLSKVPGGQYNVLDVHDGDTVYLEKPGILVMMGRLEGADAPELAQMEGTASKYNLARLLKDCGGKVTVKPVALDMYGRAVVRLTATAPDGTKIDISRHAVENGWAWFYGVSLRKKDARFAELEAAEKRARVAGLGIWQDGKPTPLEPWKFRHPKKKDDTKK